MLIEIQCDKFAPEHQIIRFNSGLNTVLGSAGGSNAIGKSTFLWIIDYVFGGESYYSLTDDIKKEIGPHTIYFTFEFEGQPYYFYRSTDDPKSVYRIDKERHFITKLTLDEFRRFLFQEYKIGLRISKFIFPSSLYKSILSILVGTPSIYVIKSYPVCFPIGVSPGFPGFKSTFTFLECAFNS